MFDGLNEIFIVVS